MTRFLTTGIATLLMLPLVGQGRLVINDDAWVRIDNGAWVVVDHGNPNGIQTLGSGGNIRSEGELNRVRWRIGATNNTYVVPFTTASGVKMPLTYQKTSAGSAAGSVVFSTFNHSSVAPANAWNNNLYRPTDVTHMLDWATGSVNNSANAVDRFWIIDTEDPNYGYTTRPNATLTFVVDRADVTGGNIINANSPVGAQRFNNSLGLWGDFLPIGVFTASAPTAATNTVSGVIVPGAEFYRSWTLSDFNNPLPIELLDFSGTCEGHVVRLKWTTASEENNDHFTVERSRDAQTWEPIGVVDGAGTSVGLLEYSFMDESPLAQGYYRLAQTDFDGTTHYHPTISAGCQENGGQEIVNAWDDGTNLNILVSSSFEDVHDLVLMDAHGKVLITRPRTAVNEGMTQISIPKGTLATGMYVVQLRGSDKSHSRRVLLN
ncbi:MAG TPA: T9SS type A sorting domain-containing protein [Flavobacteriales bacterium]|nr:T9SS type A sorting domain-containing protein [Flavobacteriales bacterium]